MGDETLLYPIHWSPTIAPQCPPNEEYIATVERACQKVNQGEEDELRAEIKGILKRSSPKPNVTKEERKTLKELCDPDHGK